MTRQLRSGTAEWWEARTTFDPATGCVLWNGFVCDQGYARTWWKGQAGVLVHRIAYEQAYGPFDPSLKVCHTCDTPRCSNPPHLFLGTQADNLRDMWAKGRARPHGRTTAAPDRLSPSQRSVVRGWYRFRADLRATDQGKTKKSASPSQLENHR